MGNTPNAYGKPVYADTFDLPGDLQDAVDFADLFANVREGTAAERAALTAGQLREGMLFNETDTGMIWRWLPAPTSAWVPFAASPSVIGKNKGSTQITSGGWQSLNTLVGGGTNLKNDGYTYGTGDIDVPFPNSLYFVTAAVKFPSATGGTTRGVKIVGHSGVEVADTQRSSGTGSGEVNRHAAGLVPIASAIVVQVIQDSGTTMNDVTLDYFSAKYMGPL